MTALLIACYLVGPVGLVALLGFERVAHEIAETRDERRRLVQKLEDL